MKAYQKNIGLVACFLAAGSQPSAVAVGPPPELLDANSFAAVSVSLEELPPPELVERAIAVAGFPPSTADTVQSAAAAIGELRGLGAYEVAAALSIDDLPGGAPPPVVVSFNEGSDLEAAKKLLQKQPWMAAPLEVRVDGDRLWIGAGKALDRAAGKTPAERDDLLQPLKDSRLAGAAASLVLSPGDDSRRVLRELWPRLDAPFERLDGHLVADGMRRIVVEFTASGDSPGVTLRVVTNSEPTADTVARIVEAGADLATENLKQLPENEAKLVKLLTEQLEPRRDGAEVLLTVNAGTATEGLMGAILPSVNDANQRARRSQKMNNMKQIALAMHNFHDTSGQFPALAAIVSDDGEPLLSWRVALLPYLEQGGPYAEFRFDEPWDSEHNLKVAADMPAVYADPLQPDLSARGLTTYQRPVYEGGDLVQQRDDAAPYERRVGDQTVRFAPGEQFRQIIDGASNTMLVAEVAPEHAVVWTKPEDWRVDLENPLAKLRTETRQGFVTAFMDGSAQFQEFSISADLLRRIITKAGRETIDWNAEYEAAK